MSQSKQYIKQPLVPNTNGCHVIQVPSGKFTVEDLLDHIDFQLGTSFVHLHQMAIESSYDEGKEAALSEMAQPVTASYEHDYDVLNRIATAEITGWVPPCLNAQSK